MGIDIYARFEGMTEAEEQNQYTGFDVTKGHVGYLREAYHGGPYATQHLVPEAFASKNGTARIPAKTLRRRLGETLDLARERNRNLYELGGNDLDEVLRAFVDFVEFCETVEQKTKKPVKIIASY